MTGRRCTLFGWLIGIVAAMGLPSLVVADVVHLTNGRSFEGVVAEETDQQVRIRLEEGVLTLPRSLVERIDKADTSLAQFLRRKQALRQSNASASSWLDLARWAETEGMTQAAREAALKAAAMNEHLAGLESILRPNGYVFDEDLGRWLSNDEEMKRRGMVEVDGEWISRHELAERRLQEQALLTQSLAAQASQDASAAAQMQMQMAGAAPYGVDSSNGYSSLLLGAGYGSLGFGRHAFRPFFSSRSTRFHVPAAVPTQRAQAHSGRPPFR